MEGLVSGFDLKEGEMGKKKGHREVGLVERVMEEVTFKSEFAFQNTVQRLASHQALPRN